MPGSWQGVSAPFSLSLGRVSPEYTQKVLNKGLLSKYTDCPEQKNRDWLGALARLADSLPTSSPSRGQPGQTKD